MNLRVVIVEPSLTVRMYLGESLQAAGFDVDACASAADARCAAVVPPPPALFVMNESLPDARGVDLVRELRGPGSGLTPPVLVMTSLDDPALAGARFGPGVYPLAKPCDAGMVAARARELVGLSSAVVLVPRPSCVLAVDDSVTFRQRVRDLLEQGGYEVITASSGEDAMACLAARDVDCVLLDMVMPGLGGEETCRRIRCIPALRTVPILILTAREGMESIVAALRAGADDFVTKSDDFAVLEARLRAQIRRRRFEEDNRRIREELHTARMEATRALAERELAETRAHLLEDLEIKNLELQRAKDRAEAAVQARDEFLMIASHELRTPLTPLQLHLQSLRRVLAEHPEGDPAGRFTSGLDVAARQTERLAALIDALLDASRMSAGRLELCPERFDLAAVTRDVVLRVAESARRTGSTITLRAEGSVCGTWDRLRCEQVATNLVSNAIKYGDGKPIEVEVRAEGHAVCLVVRDQGIGIAEEQRARIFGIFERAVSSRHYGGLGLGLYITRQIVEAHGGTIQVASRPSQGSTFTVELPVEITDQGAAPRRAA